MKALGIKNKRSILEYDWKLYSQLCSHNGLFLSDPSFFSKLISFTVACLFIILLSTFYFHSDFLLFFM